MDLLTQGLVGAAMAQSAGVRHEARMATGVGFVAGMSPDIDTLIRSADDPLLFLDFHRHFTHALVLVPAIAVVVALILWPFAKAHLPFKRLYLYALCGTLLAGILDACTSYGTMLLWPFFSERVAWSVVSIFDPVVTGALAVGVIAGLRWRTRRPALVAVSLVAMYLGLGAIQHHRASLASEALAASRGHVPERAVVKPTIGNLLLWRSLYVYDDHVYADGVRLAPLRAPQIYAGQSAKLLSADQARDDERLSRLGTSLPRFLHFADGLLVGHPQRPDMVGDARFAMLPTSLRPLWGIVPAAGDVDYSAEFVTDRALSKDERKRFIDMLLGREL